MTLRQEADYVARSIADYPGNHYHQSLSVVLRSGGRDIIQSIKDHNPDWWKRHLDRGQIIPDRRMEKHLKALIDSAELEALYPEYHQHWVQIYKQIFSTPATPDNQPNP